MNEVSNMDYKTAKRLLEENLKGMAESTIAAGYYLKHIRDIKGYEEEGCSSIWEFAERNYGIHRTTASRWMDINDKFSIGGDSPELADQYKDFSRSQLQEMLYLTDDQMEQVMPDMTVKEIRQIGKNVTPDMARVLDKPEKEEKEYLDAAAKHLIRSLWDWMREDHLNRVLLVDKSPQELRDKLGKNNRSWWFKKDNGLAHINLFDDSVQLWDTDGVCRGNYDWFYLAAAIQSMWNVVALEKAQEEKERAASHTEETQDDTPDQEEQPEVVRDEAWFVREYFEHHEGHGYLSDFMRICREYKNNGDRAKAIQKVIAPYGCHCRASSEFESDFHGFSDGIDFTADRRKYKIHMKYGRFVKEMLELYDPWDSRWAPEVVTGEVEETGSEDVITNAEPIYKCIHNPELSCPLGGAAKNTPGDGTDCDQKCCWNCPKHGLCKYECNSSRKRKQSVPEETDGCIDYETEEEPADIPWPDILSDIPRYRRQAIKDYLEDEEKTLKDYRKVEGLPENLVMHQNMKVAGLRLLLELTERLEEMDDEED